MELRIQEIENGFLVLIVNHDSEYDEEKAYACHDRYELHSYISMVWPMKEEEPEEDIETLLTEE